ncbi:1089_t:CDS:2 [Gigaspora margarita]|uniref:1089_t:CDS:1 n=1 Tax=Gigaspora margarita TaxID=4874 RepID=A0ABN7UPS5_GIGMA|nr:1089_t:CDS:2 [Gigaspora margarita]
MDIRRIDARRNDLKGSKHGSKALIRISSSVNTMSMRYAKEKELTSNQGDKISGCIPDIEVDIDSVKVDPMFDENILEEDCVMKDDDRRGNKFMNIRVINKLNERKSIQTKGVNSKNVPVKSVNQDDMGK